MRIRVSDPASLDDLAADLRECGCIADPLGPAELEVFLTTADERAERMEVRFYVNTWSIEHPGVNAEVVD
ncbi:MAG: hypothetical protein M3265_02505 [Actinomycetota bacterium]|nr:hypothetical protein [Actinomycetota bacterium]